MLYTEDRKGSQKNFCSLIGLFSLLLFFTACHQGTHSNRTLTMEAFSAMKAPTFVFDYQSIQKHLRQIAAADAPVVLADKKTRKYYLQGHHLLWINQAGLTHQADSLLARLHTVGAVGMSERAFYVHTIEADMKRLRTLDFREQGDINAVAARLDYFLTKACLRYVYGERFGFINPKSVFNNLDVEKRDTLGSPIKYYGLFDYDMDYPKNNYDSIVRTKIMDGSIVDYLQEIQIKDDFYEQLKAMLAKSPTEEMRQAIICNMERQRWRLRHPMAKEGKRIIVNIPAYHLYAYDDDDLLDMRVVCGAFNTKTPLLTSAIEWMEINPQWVIPRSIIEKDVVRHIGDSAYFARNNYQVYHRKTNQQIVPEQATREMLLSGDYRVAQQSGSDNSLGRIVFRFRNNFSVFLHYTSNPSAFQRDRRAMSHGCVRVEKPFELAEYLLDNPDEWLLDRIRISMDLKPETERGWEYLKTHKDEKEHKLIGYVPVKPKVPLYIIYYTLWPDEKGVLQKWRDVYGYDKVIWENLQTYYQ